MLYVWAALVIATPVLLVGAWLLAACNAAADISTGLDE